jgi:RNA polymerase sigma-70 factor (ECF subfamily)
VVLLREFEGLSYAEIARVIRRPVGTVMSRLFHARRRLQASLEVYWEGES